MNFFKKIITFLWIILLIGCVTAGYDYYRITQGEAPIFCIRSYNQKSHTETSRGMFYKVDRIVKWNKKENYNLSSSIKYNILGFTVPVVLERPKQTNDYVLYIKEEKECMDQSNLYVELKDYNIYIDCISNIQIKEKNEKKSSELKDILGKDNNKIIDIINRISFIGIDEDKTTEIYTNENDNFINKKIYIYKCHTEEVKDIYITNKQIKEEDYCTVKDVNTNKEQE